MHFDGVADREAAEALRGVVLARRARSTTPTTLWVHELVGADGRRRSTAPRVGAVVDGRRRTRPATCSCSTPARSCPSCSSSTATPTARVVDRPARRPASTWREPPCASTSSRSSRRWSTASPARACSARPQERGLLDVRVHDLRGRDHRPAPHGRRRARSAAAPAWCSCPSRSSPPSRRSTRPGRCSYLGPGRPAPRPGLGPRAGRRRRVLACCAAATRASTSGCASTSSTASCPSATTCWRRRGGGHGRARGGRPARARRDGQRRVGRRRVASATGCSSTRSTPGRPSSGAGRCPRCCAPATTAGSPAGGGPRRWPARATRRPDLLEARGGLTDEEQRLLAEFDL